jgi:hypothetical protein
MCAEQLAAGLLHGLSDACRRKVAELLVAIFAGRRRINDGEIAAVAVDSLWHPCGVSEVRA